MQQTKRPNVDFSGQNVTGVLLGQSSLQKANLCDSNAIGVNLTSANIRRANLANADLTGAVLTGADFTDAQYCNTIMPDGSVKAPEEGMCRGQQEPQARPSQ